MDAKADIEIDVFDRETADQLRPFCGRLESEGYGVEAWDSIRGLVDPGPIADWVIEITVVTAFGNEVYPRIRKVLRDWFTEIPEEKRKRVRATLFDQERNVIDEVRLPDDL